MTIDARHPLPGKSPLVMGAARSGLAAARLLARHGLDVRLVDAKLAEPGGAERGAELVREGVCGSWDRDDRAPSRGATSSCGAPASRSGIRWPPPPAPPACRCSPSSRSATWPPAPRSSA